jgi:hypothetical protein
MDGDYPATTYTRTYEFAGPQRLTVVCTTSGTGYLATLSTTTTAVLPAGVYAWQAFASATSVRVLRDSGRVIVLPDLATVDNAGEVDLAQSPARQIRDNLGKMLANQSYVKALPSDQLTALYTAYKQAVWDVKREEDTESLARGGSPTNKIGVRFTSR